MPWLTCGSSPGRITTAAKAWEAARRDVLPSAELAVELERDPQLFLVARRLFGELETRFAALRCPRVNSMVVPDDVEGLRFWQALGYLPLPDVPCSKPIADTTTS